MKRILAGLMIMLAVRAGWGQGPAPTPTPTPPPCNCVPIIGNFPSPIVGNAEPTTATGPAGRFVYIDAFCLNPLAQDDRVPPENRMWTYTMAGTP